MEAEGAVAGRSDSVGTVRATVDTPSTNLVRKMMLALLNMPSLRDTTMNCDCGKCVLIIRLRLGQLGLSQWAVVYSDVVWVNLGSVSGLWFTAMLFDANRPTGVWHGATENGP